MSTPTPLRQQVLDDVLGLGADPQMAQRIVDSMDDEQLQGYLENRDKIEREKTELRDRIMDDPTLRAAVSPSHDWKTKQDRYDVIRRAVKILDATEEKHNLPAGSIAAQIVAGDDTTVAEGIRIHGDDPRTEQWGSTFYAFRWAIRRALESIEREATREAREARRLRLEEQGYTVCTRCGGEGESERWAATGRTCFDCDGRGFTDSSR